MNQVHKSIHASLEMLPHPLYEVDARWRRLNLLKGGHAGQIIINVEASSARICYKILSSESMNSADLIVLNLKLATDESEQP